MHSGTRKILWSGVEWQKMEVFNVLVLVLVVEAVHSHGKTVSESTIYNKTQAYKSETTYYIQQDTASWKFEQCNLWFFILWSCMQWPTSFWVWAALHVSAADCQQFQPQNYTANRSKGIDCTDPSLRQYPLFNISQAYVCQIQKIMHVIVHIYKYIHSQNCRREL